jgi:valyl-tRNA synthetase
VKPVLGSLDGGEPRPLPEPEALTLYEDRWILSKLAAACDAIARGIEEFAFQDSINAAYAFAWNEFCDWWLEAAKPRLKAADPVAQSIGVYCLDSLIRALHPFMPFVTEELWSRLPGDRDFVMRNAWPDDASRYIDAQVELDFESLMAMVSEIRSYRKSVSGAPAKGGAVKLDEQWDKDWQDTLSRIGEVAVTDALPPGKALGLAGGSVVFPQVEAADASVTARKVEQLRKDLERVEAKLANEQFMAKAPPEEIAKQQGRAEELRASIERLS